MYCDCFFTNIIGVSFFTSCICRVVFSGELYITLFETTSIAAETDVELLCVQVGKLVCMAYSVV